MLIFEKHWGFIVIIALAMVSMIMYWVKRQSEEDKKRSANKRWRRIK